MTAGPSSACGPRSASPRLVLASASRTRQRLLSDAGLAYDAAPADVDEAAVRIAMRAASRSAEEVATALAEAKAAAVAGVHPDALVVGADQMLECDGQWFEKPADLAEAERNLRILRGRRHRLVSAVAVALEGRCAWTHVDVAVMSMRAFSDDVLADYLDRAGAAALDTVAGYRFEGPGIQLFDAVEGDMFTILGLPLLPLLACLRRCGAVAD
ncbi:MAG: Maf family protein [Rhodospirillales bacterium]|nr:Maf family protein [Rhodospirillales bacterium]